MSKSISIITPTLNQGEYIEECIDSILSQGYDKLDYIIIDGGSSDNTIDIIKKYEKHLSYWVSEPDSGQSHAINKGLKKANGDIINWLNSDDYLEKGSLKIIAEKFENPDTNIFSGRSNIIKDKTIVKQSSGLDVYPNNLAKTIGMARIDQPETYWRKSVIDSLGLLNSKLHFIMDRDWWIRYLLSYGLNGISQSEDIIANFRLHEDSKTVSNNSSFNKERNMYFMNFAKHINNHSLSELFELKTTDLNINFNSSIPSSELNKIIDYFLLLKADEEYSVSNMRFARKICSKINKDSLAEDDLKLFNKLKLRSRYIPKVVHKLIHSKTK